MNGKGNPPPGTDAGAYMALPVEVREALAQRNAIEAVKRLRAATGMGLKEAMAVVQAQLEGRTPPPLPSLAPLEPAAPATIHPAVLAALQQGNKIEAIRLLREHSSLGLKEAKDMLASLPQVRALLQQQQEKERMASGLAPGEVPRVNGAGRWVVLILVAGALAWWWLRRGG